MTPYSLSSLLSPFFSIGLQMIFLPSSLLQKYVSLQGGFENSEASLTLILTPPFWTPRLLVNSSPKVFKNDAFHWTARSSREVPQTNLAPPPPTPAKSLPSYLNEPILGMISWLSVLSDHSATLNYSKRGSFQLTVSFPPSVSEVYLAFLQSSDPYPS